jgi:acid phosphatase
MRHDSGKDRGRGMRRSSHGQIASLALGAALVLPPLARAADEPRLEAIETIVVLYAENRSFDNLYGLFPGANGLQNVLPDAARQIDRDGTVLPELPPIWEGLTAPGVKPPISEARTAHLPNAPFAIDNPKRFNLSLAVATHDLVHRFYQNQMQINGGRNDRFVAYGDSGALVMGHYDSSMLALWNVAQKYVLADNFFMGAFGGSFMNHIYLACACVAEYPKADKSPAKSEISAVEPDGVSLKVTADSPKSALQGIPIFVNDKGLTPDFYAVNTMQPPYQPSGIKPTKGGDPRFANPNSPMVLVPQTQTTIGDLLSTKGITWAYYAGAWRAALEGRNSTPTPNFTYHHQPFNYFANYAPGTAARAEHLRDGGLFGGEFIKAIDSGTLPQVTFYKPQGNLNEHPGYADVLAGDEHLAELVRHLENSPQWPHMLVIVTYDENGGFWDHVAPPKGDRWGPAIRIPTLIISPFAKRGTVDHALYDTGSILRLITRRFDLPMLDGLKLRDEEMAKAGSGRVGDLTAALDLQSK